MRKKMFISHTWRKDTLGRNTHERAKELSYHLMQLGWKVWFDEHDMGLNLDASMVNGIEHCDVFVLCFTKEYSKQLNSGSFNLQSRYNCLKEFTYANARNKLILCVMFEPFSGTWPMGIITMYLGNMLYVDGTGDDLKKVAEQITTLLKRHNISPNKKFWKNVLFRSILCKKTKEMRQISKQRRLSIRDSAVSFALAKQSLKNSQKKIKTVIRI